MIWLTLCKFINDLFRKKWEKLGRYRTRFNLLHVTIKCNYIIPINRSQTIKSRRIQWCRLSGLPATSYPARRRRYHPPSPTSPSPWSSSWPSSTSPYTSPWESGTSSDSTSTAARRSLPRRKWRPRRQKCRCLWSSSRRRRRSWPGRRRCAPSAWWSSRRETSWGCCRHAATASTRSASSGGWLRRGRAPTAAAACATACHAAARRTKPCQFNN